MYENELHHFAVIADGNGRWAKANGLNRLEGHIQGDKNFDAICEAVDLLGIKYFTIYGFSTENWDRPKEEVSNLLRLFSAHIQRYMILAKEKNYKMRIIGSREVLTPELCGAIETLENATRDNTGLNVQIAFNYGGRDEIVRAAKCAIEKNKGNGEITEQSITESLDTYGVPDPDVIVRTGGEQRLSNFLLWQSAYAELFFVDKYWPDFSYADVESIIQAYCQRTRRFGRV